MKIETTIKNLRATTFPGLHDTNWMSIDEFELEFNYLTNLCGHTREETEEIINSFNIDSFLNELAEKYVKAIERRLNSVLNVEIKLKFTRTTSSTLYNSSTHQIFFDLTAQKKALEGALVNELDIHYDYYQLRMDEDLTDQIGYWKYYDKDRRLYKWMNELEDGVDEFDRAKLSLLIGYILDNHSEEEDFDAEVCQSAEVYVSSHMAYPNETSRLSDSK